MERYLIKASFFNPEDLTAARAEMVRTGIPLSDIDQLTIKKSKGRHLFFGRVNRGPELALKIMPIGFAIGLIVYLASVYTSDEVAGFWNSLTSVNLFNLLFTVFAFGYLFMVLGYLFGKRSIISTIEYTSGKGKSVGRNVLMVNADEDVKDAVMRTLAAHSPASLDIVDSKFEVEVGLRNQESA